MTPREMNIYVTSTLIFLIYVIGLHAVQFGNNWLKKILKRLEEIVGEVHFGSQRNVLKPLITKLD